MYAIYIEWDGPKAGEISQRIYMAVDIDGVNRILNKFKLLEDNEEFGDGTTAMRSYSQGYYFQQV